MMGKTHLAVGIASAYLLLQPSTPSQLIAATIGGSVGGIMADIDVKIDRSNKYSYKNSIDALYGETAAGSLSLCALVSDFFTSKEICTSILSHWQRSSVGIVLLISLIVVGELSKKHRDRTHSLLALVLFSLSALLIHSAIGFSFFVGYGSHLIIDMFNKSPIRLFYPLKKGVCFKLCYADRWGNEIFFIAGICLITLYCFLHSTLINCSLMTVLSQYIA